MDSPDPASILSNDDQLSLWVGRVARVHALLEYNLSNVHGALRPPEASGVRNGTPPSVDQLIADCRRLLKTSHLSREVIGAGTQALTAAKVANALRNRMVHDIWLPGSQSEHEQAPSWDSFQRLQGQLQPYALSTPRDLGTVVSAHTTLVRSRLRVSALFMALHQFLPWLSHGRPLHPPGPALTTYVALMSDRFTLEPNGDFKILGAE